MKFAAVLGVPEDFLEEIALPQFKSRTGHDIQIASGQTSVEVLEEIRGEVERGGRTADFIWVNLRDLGSYLRYDLLMDLTDLVEPFKDQLPPAYLKAVSNEDGRIVAVPHHLLAYLTVYNQEAIPRVSLPDTYLELLSWSEVNEGRYAYGGEEEFLKVGLVGLFHAWGALGQGRDIGKLFDRRVNPGIVDAFEYLSRLHPHSRKPPPSGPTESDGWLASGEVWLSSTWGGNLMKLRTFGNSDHLRLHPNLGLAGPDGNRSIITEAWVLAVPKASPHPEEAKAFIGLLMEPRMQAMAMATESKIYTGGFPARADALDLIPDVVREWFDLADVEQFKRMAFKNFVIIPYVSYWGSISRLMGELYRSVVTEGGDVGRALDLAQADLELIMRAVQR